MTEILVRRLLPEEADAYRRIRLEALATNPEAFASSLAAEQPQPLAWFAERLASSAAFGAFANGELVGTAGFFVQPGEKHAHKGVLVGMYVRPQARRAGIGRRLVAAALDHARGRVELVRLTVVGDNQPARRLYAGFGFEEYGLERNALKQEGRYYDEVLMALPLNRP